MRNKMGSNPIVVVAFKTDQQLFFEDFYAENKRGGFESHSTRWALMFGVAVSTSFSRLDFPTQA